ncbi:hypothetical protein [Streptomyces sp. NPDC006012]|uniref:hypothetical protein n=1 Tax=Streptomyces sp. NPDC006012 TaxID=3364739 RepID=UPI00369CBD4E
MSPRALVPTDTPDPNCANARHGTPDPTPDRAEQDDWRVGQDQQPAVTEDP